MAKEFALVVDGTIVEVADEFPGSARILATGEWLCPPGGLVNVPARFRELCGWYTVIDQPPDADTTTQVVEKVGYKVIAGAPWVDYQVRDKTAAEVTAETEEADARTERDAARAAYDTLGDYLGLESPTAAQTRTVVKLLVRITRRLIRDQYGK